MNILIYGAGAIGSHLAYCLMDKSNNISIIVKKKYLKKIKEDGINIFPIKSLKKK